MNLKLIVLIAGLVVISLLKVYYKRKQDED